MNIKIKNVVEVEAVNQGAGRNDKFPIHKIELESGRAYLFKHGEFSASGIVDTFIPIEWISKNESGIYDMSTELNNKSNSHVRGTLKLNPRQYRGLK